jgi:hypothetical protein
MVSVPGKPNNVLHTLSLKCITVTWQPPTDCADIRGYTVYCNGRSVDCPYTFYELKDPIPETVYNIQVSANSEHGEGEKSPVTVVEIQPLGKSKQYVAGVVKCPFCKQTELVVVQ